MTATEYFKVSTVFYRRLDLGLSAPERRDRAPALCEETRVPLFNFHVFDGKQQFDDSCDLIDAESARCEALRTVGGMLSEYDRSYWGGEPLTLRVTDSAGGVICQMKFSAVSA